MLNDIVHQNLHMPKTAGTSLTAAVMASAGHSNKTVCYHIQSAPDDDRILSPLPSAPVGHGARQDPLLLQLLPGLWPEPRMPRISGIKIDSFWDQNPVCIASPQQAPPVKYGFRDQHQILLGSDLRLAKALWWTEGPVFLLGSLISPGYILAAR